MKFEHVIGFQGASLLAKAVDSFTKSHPFWVFESKFLYGQEVLYCAPALFLSGVLCSAGGIGGGGVYVTVLMVIAQLAPRDAVPLSKAIVFIGSLASLFLNLRKMASTQPGNSVAPSLIDYSICRIVVPAALLGTLLGVLFNRISADWVIISALCFILGSITVMVTRTALRQRREEFLEDSPEDSVHLPIGRAALGGYGALEKIKKRSLGTCSFQDMVLGGGLLLTVILCGVLRAHASACAAEMSIPVESRRHACHHPINLFVFRNMLEGWMTSPATAKAIQQMFLVVPIFTCLAVMIYYSRVCVAKEGWSWRDIALYEAMGVTTGCLAGLVGIGGGLIFSPFFLVLGVEPHVAVATSSTCVIFTSSSTTLQYLLTDRIITSLAVIYGIVNLLASWAGTSLMHFMMDKGARKSYITMIVALGVLVSAVLSVVKLIATAEAHRHSPKVTVSAF